MHRAPGLPRVAPIVLSPFVFYALVMLAPPLELVAQVQLSATLEGQVSVSYTHLTLPTILLV